VELSDLDKWTEITKDRKQFCSWCDDVYNSPYFQLMVKRLQFDLLKEAFDEKSPEDMKEVQMTSKGIDYLVKHLLTFSNEFKNINKPKEDFDNSKMIGRL
jgi:hypothetical protein